MTVRIKSNTSGSFFVPHDLDAPVVGSASGPLGGLVAVVKDLFDIAGTRTGGGNPEWLAAQAPARAHAAAVAKILDAGATITGKTICDEFFFSGSGINAHYGTPMNIRAPGRIPGGSSSGSAAATAANACDFALGSDTGGSVRMPASYCGVYALRPTHGRIDLAGAMAMAPSFDTAGFFANGPGVARRVGAVLLDDKPVRAPIRRLRVALDAFAQADAPVAALGREFLARAARVLPPTEGREHDDRAGGLRHLARRLPHRAGARDLGHLRRLRHAREAGTRAGHQGAHGLRRDGDAGAGG